MAMSERARNKLFNYFSRTELGEEVTSEMLSQFPARDVEEPVTKEFLRSELAFARIELHDEMHGLRNELRGDMRQQFYWLMSTILVVLGVLSGLIIALH